MIINENGWGDKAPEVEAEVKESVRAKKLKKQAEETEVVEEDAEQE